MTPVQQTGKIMHRDQHLVCSVLRKRYCAARSVLHSVELGCISKYIVCSAGFVDLEPPSQVHVQRTLRSSNMNMRVRFARLSNFRTNIQLSFARFTPNLYCYVLHTFFSSLDHTVF